MLIIYFQRDITFARIVLVNILEEILSKIPDKKDYLLRVNEIFNKMLKSSYKHDQVFVETLMEIAFFHANDITLDSNILATGTFCRVFIGFCLVAGLVEFCYKNYIFLQRHIPVDCFLWEHYYWKIPSRK